MRDHESANQKLDIETTPRVHRVRDLARSILTQLIFNDPPLDKTKVPPRQRLQDFCDGMEAEIMQEKRSAARRKNM